jgi:hypothetical protein
MVVAKWARHSHVLFGRDKLLIVVNWFNVLASRHVLTSTPFANYNDDGFVVLPDAVTPSQAAQLDRAYGGAAESAFAADIRVGSATTGVTDSSTEAPSSTWSMLPRTRTIVVTAEDPLECRPAALAAGAFAFVEKRAMRTDLLPAVELASHELAA